MDSVALRWWQREKDDWDNVKVDLIDELHFWMSKCQIAGLTAEDVIELYKRKNSFNWKRQDEGYREAAYQKTIDGKNDTQQLFEK